MSSGEEALLRREHDALAEKLAARKSIDEVRKAAYASFFGLVATGLSVKLAWDRWFSDRAVVRFEGPPVFFFIALAVTLALVAYATRAFVRARRHMRVEDEAFARLRALRDRLGLDP